MQVNSQNDCALLEKAKEMTYLKGFYEGVSECVCVCVCVGMMIFYIMHTR